MKRNALLIFAFSALFGCALCACTNLNLFIGYARGNNVSAHDTTMRVSPDSVCNHPIK